VDVTPGLRRDPVPDLDAVGQDEELVARIRNEIARDGPITFARFMELALYDPDGGYYRGESARPGRDGDFLTAPEAHPIFGATLASQAAAASRSAVHCNISLPPGSTIDAFGLLSYVDQNFNSGISDESGVTGDAGVRLAVTPKIEVSGYGEWADVEKSEVGFGAGARYYLTERLSLGVRALFIDTGDQWVGGLRFQF
jgi:hypothetical protein